MPTPMALPTIMTAKAHLGLRVPNAAALDEGHEDKRGKRQLHELKPKPSQELRHSQTSV